MRVAAGGYPSWSNGRKWRWRSWLRWDPTQRTGADGADRKLVVTLTTQVEKPGMRIKIVHPRNRATGDAPGTCCYPYMKTPGVVVRCKIPETTGFMEGRRF